MDRVKKFRHHWGIRGFTVILDHKCFVMYKRHSRKWWRRWWRRHRREWWRHHHCCPFLIVLASLWNFAAWCLVFSIICRCCCRRRCRRNMNNYVDDLASIENRDQSGVMMMRERNFRHITFNISTPGNVNPSPTNNYHPQPPRQRTFVPRRNDY